jgi:hypothetical protein
MFGMKPEYDLIRKKGKPKEYSAKLRIANRHLQSTKYLLY